MASARREGAARGAALMNFREYSGADRAERRPRGLCGLPLVLPLPSPAALASRTCLQARYGQQHSRCRPGDSGSEDAIVPVAWNESGNWLCDGWSGHSEVIAAVLARLWE
jgi:hypothetical protein